VDIDRAQPVVKQWFIDLYRYCAYQVKRSFTGDPDSFTFESAKQLTTPSRNLQSIKKNYCTPHNSKVGKIKNTSTKRPNANVEKIHFSIPSNR